MAADKVMLVRGTASEVKGACDSEMALVDDCACIVSMNAVSRCGRY